MEEPSTSTVSILLLLNYIKYHIHHINKEAIWLYAELFLGHHDGSCHGLWGFVVIHVMLCAGFCHSSWWFMSWFVVICSDF